jgi:diguanylate cyclase (GGDEF)-like protein/PAS domain S-box-containing protein
VTNTRGLLHRSYATWITAQNQLVSLKKYDDFIWFSGTANRSILRAATRRKSIQTTPGKQGAPLKTETILNEATRIQALHQFEVLDTPPEPALDDLVALAANVCGAPIALLSLVDEDRIWFKARFGLDLTSIPREGALCGETIAHGDLLIIEDLRQDARFAKASFVVGEPNIGFYAGAPLTTSNGEVLGTLCVMDRKPRQLAASQIQALKILSYHVMTQLEHRRNLMQLAKAVVERDQAQAALRQAHDQLEVQVRERTLELTDTNALLQDEIVERKRIEAQIRESEAKFRLITENIGDLVAVLDTEGRRLYNSPSYRSLFGESALEIGSDSFLEIHAEDQQHIREIFRDSVRRGVGHRARFRFVDGNGQVRFVESQGSPIRDTQGQVTKMVVVSRDISERMRQEQDLEMSFSLLRATLESTADGLLAVDSAGRIQSHNHKFAEMWNLPEEILQPREDTMALGHVLDQLKDPDAFLAKVNELYIEPDAESFDLLEFKDGRVFERYSKPQRVGGRVVGRVWSFRDISERKRAQEHIQHLAHHDALTGLPNRVLLRDRVTQAIAMSARNHSNAAVLFLDLDRFKVINDSLGHHMGDELLQSVAKRLQDCVRDLDTVARLGGDEFVVALPYVREAHDAGLIAAKIIDSLAQPFDIAGNELLIGTSIGISLFPVDGTDVDALMRNADAAMYHAKESGRGNYQFYSVELNAKANQRLQMENTLRQAIARDRLTIHYQPIVELDSGRVIGAEALLRLVDKDGALMMPGQFIGVAEDSGLIVPMGRWVLERACKQAAQWRTADGKPLKLAVNLSARQLGQKQFSSELAKIVIESGFDAHDLELEINEALLTRTEDGVQQSLAALAELGVRISVDDFGTGYSRLTDLKRHRLATFKIDGTIVAGLGDGEDGKNIVAAMIAMAKNLGKDIVAESVETAEQRDLLTALGCKKAQGRLFSAPVTAAEFTTLLKN